MKFKAQRTFDMSDFGWKDCKFVFNALTWGEQKELDKARIEWSKAKDGDVEQAANKIVDLMQKKFVRGQALDEKDGKVDVKTEDFDDIPFDVFLKLLDWLVSGEVSPGLKAV